MINNDFTRQWFATDYQSPTHPLISAMRMPVQAIDAQDIAHAVAWLVSDDARYITGVTLPVDAGYVNKR